MAGHSHYKNMAHRKGIVDAKRGKLWSKLSRAIMVAAKNGGGDPVMNIRLRVAIDDARSVSMPKENIERAVKKGCGELEGTSFDSITYEGFAQGGVAIMVDVHRQSQSHQRRSPQNFERGGGNMGEPAVPSTTFERKGLFNIP